MDISELGEFGLLRRLRNAYPCTSAVMLPAGDDCAVLRYGTSDILVSTDAFVEDIHFRRAWATPYQIGWKAAAAALSDIAAMGGIPSALLVTLGLPPGARVEAVDDLYAGLGSCCRKYQVALVGGDTVAHPDRWFLGITVLGKSERSRWLGRGGARSGDVLVVTGPLGGSAAGLALLQRYGSITHAAKAAAEGHPRRNNPLRIAERLVRTHLLPEPRVEEGRWLVSQRGVHALIDISDGLVQDAGHMAEESGVGVNIETAAVPLHPDMPRAECLWKVPSVSCALFGGEDYELLAAVSPRVYKTIATAFQSRFGRPLPVIGKFSPDYEGVLVDGRTIEAGGYDHFRKRQPTPRSAASARNKPGAPKAG